MARIDRRRLDDTTHSLAFDVPVRFDDIDVQGHVNNAAAVVILQETRADFNLALGLSRLRGELRVMVAALSVEYAAEMHHPGLITVHTGVLAIGRSALTLGQVARQNGRSALYAQAVLVFADETGSAAIPSAARAAYARYQIAAP